MKHLILSGGKPAERGAWVHALLAHAGREARVALCMFASEDETLAQAMATGLKAVIADAAEIPDISFKVLDAANFKDVSAWANVIVISGGDPAKLKKELEPHGDLMQVWDGKTIAGSSAGADIMCKRYAYLQDKTFGGGFGWVPANIIPHWQAETWPGWDEADWAWAAKELSGKAGEAPLLTIREGEFVEIAVQ
ncbi:MAG TPA: Type 1 glutamine amidotransferase-like domain-containing protein [Candidatus Saccharimonadales bacterium]|nr:Type 1 glutamine amidotransferase-like domain-containing protein [Candidatus Saccharimonadales bacterium]